MQRNIVILTGIALLIALGVIVLKKMPWDQDEVIFEDLTYEGWYTDVLPGKFAVRLAAGSVDVDWSTVETSVYYKGEYHGPLTLLNYERRWWHIESMETHDCLPAETITYHYKVLFKEQNSDETKEAQSTLYKKNLGYDDLRWESDKQVGVYLVLGRSWFDVSDAPYGDDFKATLVVKVRRQNEGGAYRFLNVEMVPDENSYPGFSDNWTIEVPSYPDPMNLNCGDSIQFDITFVPGYGQFRPVGYRENATIGINFTSPDGATKTYLIPVIAINERQLGTVP